MSRPLGERICTPPGEPDRNTVDVGTEREGVRTPQERLGLVESSNVRRRRSREHRCEQCRQLVPAAGDKFSDLHRSSMTAPTCSNGPTTAPMPRTN